MASTGVAVTRHFTASKASVCSFDRVHPAYFAIGLLISSIKFQYALEKCGNVVHYTTMSCAPLASMGGNISAVALGLSGWMSPLMVSLWPKKITCPVLDSSICLSMQMPLCISWAASSTSTSCNVLPGSCYFQYHTQVCHLRQVTSSGPSSTVWNRFWKIRSQPNQIVTKAICNIQTGSGRLSADSTLIQDAKPASIL